MAISKIVGTSFRQIVKKAETNVMSAITSDSTPILRRMVPLKTDIANFSGTDFSRWTKNAEEYIPAVFKGSAVPMHHEINGVNNSVRNFIEYKKTGIIPYKDKEDIEWFLETVKDGEKAIKNIDESFKGLLPLEKDCIVYRGRAENPLPCGKKFNVDFGIIDKAKVGDIIVPDTAYSYCAFKKSLANCWGGTGARSFAHPGESNRIMMMTIRLPKGAKVSRNLEHGGEVVMPRGAEYRLISKDVKENGDIDVLLEYVLPIIK